MIVLCQWHQYDVKVTSLFDLIPITDLLVKISRVQDEYAIFQQCVIYRVQHEIDNFE